MASRANVSPDLVWECVNGRSSYLHKSKMSGGVYFSRDPYNLVNKHSRKQEGFVNSKAISIQPATGESKGIVLTTKKPSASANKPASSTATTTFSGITPARKIYKSVAGQTAKKGYRADLRGDAVSRVSAIKLSQRVKKEAPPKKLRGKKKRKAEADED